ncbi:hypothetical protein OG601_42935 [Streptomyces sp. NBC_01239]|uniref:hypothetical protein n=1 Tax=Streptomyces sp. NBC_01239 TaxID=2903792 RepID=UPI00224F0C27|nr:hypothetical protein [Streptomyces sp. NBC_01239]MCX4817357.1 hypothetical protein [Streptomyces sp. NBC_01239]
MSYGRGFAPWIAAGFVSAVDWRWGAVAGVVVGVLLLLQDRSGGVAMDAMVLEISTIVYFVIIGAIAFSSPDSSVQDHSDVLSFVWLAGTAWGSMLLRSPFTLGIARRQTPEEYWDTPGFLAVNNAITAAWGAGFTFIAVVLAISSATGAPVWVGITAHVIGLLAPAIFTSVYPKRVQARLEAMQAASA